MRAVPADRVQADLSWRASPGVETLRRVATMDQYNRWIARTLAAHVGARVLEVGCGIGNLTPFFLGAERLTCIDVLPEAIALMREKLAGSPQARALVADIADPRVVERVGATCYDTVVCINVLEHIQRDGDALRHMHAALVPGGKLLLFVPAGPYLYGQLDAALGHHRRYALRPLRDLVVAQGFEPVETFYMNVAGIPGWFLTSRVLRRSVPPLGLLRLFNVLTPLLSWCEERLRPPVGQSIVCVARRRP